MEEKFTNIIITKAKALPSNSCQFSDERMIRINGVRQIICLDVKTNGMVT